MKRFMIQLVVLILVLSGLVYFLKGKSPREAEPKTRLSVSATVSPAQKNSDPLTITAMRQKSYPGSTIQIEKTLSTGLNYNRYLVSYYSEELKQYGLLTVPTGNKPAGGWPVILFNHGYIPPESYSADSSYYSFVDAFASNGFIVFKPDYRGNGNSDGSPVQPYVSPLYTTDSMNALRSIMQYKDANPQKVGVAGHSMGGNITLHELVMTKDVKAAVLLAGVVGDEKRILDWWERRFAQKSIAGNDLDTYFVVRQMVESHGTFEENPEYWNSLDPVSYITEITAPVQIQVGSADTAVPPDFSRRLKDKLEQAGKTVEFYEYSGADHNLSPNASTALSRAVAFFTKYLK